MDSHFNIEQPRNHATSPDLAGIPRSPFQNCFLALNRIDEFERWILYPGMLLGSPEKWWGRGGSRTSPHEGIDLCCYSSTKAGEMAVQPGMKVPSPYSGTVVGTVDDFIGKSVFIRHEEISNLDRHFFTLFGHTKLQSIVNPGTELKACEMVATIAPPRVGQRDLPCHLHLSQAWIHDSLSPDTISWETISDARIMLVDPLAVLGLPHVIKERRHP